MNSPALTVRDIEIERLERAFDLAYTGSSRKKIVEALGLSPRTYARLRAKDESFKLAMDRARAEGYDSLADDVLTLVDDDIFSSDPQILKLKSDNMKWYLGVMHPSKYGLRTTVVSEFVDLGAALKDAKSRAAIDITPQLDPFE